MKKNKVMDKFFKYISLAFNMLTAIAILSSCTSEAPFSSDGQGLVRMNVTVDSRVTRAIADEEAELLREKCRIYISNSGGVLHKWEGVYNIPSNGIYLRYGTYVAEAFAGDSVTVSLDKKYYKGITEFSVGPEVKNSQVNVVCKIANVVASIDNSTIDYDQISDLSVKFENSRGEISLADENLYSKAYFMMPSEDSTVRYTITGTNNLKGSTFTKTGEIDNVLPGHEYRLKFNWASSGEGSGGALFSIKIVEESLIEDEVIIYGAPVFSWVTNSHSHDIDEQLIATPGTYESHSLRIAAYKGFGEIVMTTDNPIIIEKLGGSEFEIDDLTAKGKSDLERQGIKISEPEEQSGDLYKMFIEFSSDFLNGLPESKEEYVIHFTATDKQENPKTTEMDVRIANTETAIVYKSPILFESSSLDPDQHPMAVLSTSATIPVTFTKDNVENPGMQYREAGSTLWLLEPVAVTRANQEGIVTLKDLKPNTTYECRAVAGEFNGDEYEFVSDIVNFTTETKFTIPNASMEDWSTYGKSITFPGAGSERTFWDSGNEGAAKASDVLTTPSTDFFHSGEKSAKLESKFASILGVGKFAAGNLFAGKYEKTDGTNGVLTFGRPYDGSHPSKLTLWVNYVPGDITDRNTNNLKDREKDLGQIYIALSTEPVEIRTKNSSKLFNKNDDCILAYGEMTFEDNYNDNGNLKKVEIPLEYYEKANTVKPLYLIIVCSASKFGDFFEGGRGSTMYVDDFELIYE